MRTLIVLMGLVFVVGCAEDKEAKTDFQKFLDRRADDKQTNTTSVYQGNGYDYSVYGASRLMEVKRLVDLGLQPNTQKSDCFFVHSQFSDGQKVYKWGQDPDCHESGPRLTKRMSSIETFRQIWSGPKGWPLLEEMKYNSEVYEVSYGATSSIDKTSFLQINDVDPSSKGGHREERKLTLYLPKGFNHDKPVYRFHYIVKSRDITQFMRQENFRIHEWGGHELLAVVGVLKLDKDKEIVKSFPSAKVVVQRSGVRDVEKKIRKNFDWIYENKFSIYLSMESSGPIVFSDSKDQACLKTTGVFKKIEFDNDFFRKKSETFQGPLTLKGRCWLKSHKQAESNVLYDRVFLR